MDKVRLSEVIIDARGNKVRLEKVRINSGGYTDCGDYLGTGEPVYFVHLGDAFDHLQGKYIRASSREDAKEQLRRQYPNIRFYR